MSQHDTAGIVQEDEQTLRVAAGSEESVSTLLDYSIDLAKVLRRKPRTRVRVPNDRNFAWIDGAIGERDIREYGSRRLQVLDSFMTGPSSARNVGPSQVRLVDAPQNSAPP